ncbi:MAG: hypothetical protein QXJ02_04990 [Candidatus Bathyarchaeia archaeon]
MALDKELLFSFIVLSFAIFIAGFLTGMLAIAVLDPPIETTEANFIFFAVGLIVGTVMSALILAAIKARRARESASAQTSNPTV